MESLKKFEELGLSEQSLKALLKKGFEEPTPIQAKTIPLLLENQIDIVGQAQTGTGKTAAFGLPLIELLSEKSKNIQALILTPTRELAIQVSEEINSLKGRKRLQIIPIYGGQSMELQLKRLRKGVEIVVGTPGRILDHIRRKTINLEMISHLILDEADEMLNMGFIQDVEEILNATNTEKRVLLFSATMPAEILKIAKKYMANHKVVRTEKKHLTTDLTEQIYFEVNQGDKFDALCRIIDIEKDFYGLVFCRTKVNVDMIANKLMDRGYDAEALHGDVSQYQRERILNKFKKKRINVMVATDVAARGIDIHDLSHVINYSLPQDPESYVHRIGRTGRAGKEGTAITFVTPSEYRKMLYIKKIAKTEIQKRKIPDVNEIIKVKRARIKSELHEVIENKIPETYLDIAKELLNENNPELLIAALLKQSYQAELDESSYSNIKDVSIDRKGKTRLFIALGRNNEMHARNLVEFIKDETNVPDRKIRDVRVFDNFSFITVPFEEAELILEVFKRKHKGKRPLVTRAKERK